jgi:hypothetical protein
VYVNSVVRYFEEKSISAIGHGKKNTSYAAVPVLAFPIVGACMNMAVSHGSSVISVALIS